MMGNRINIRTAKALTLLAVYLLSTVSAALIVLTCHCHHLHAHHDSHACHDVECCCGHGHAEHLADCGHESATHFAERCCNHDHSTETLLYTADSDKSANIRITVTCTDAIASAHHAPDALPSVSGNSFAERRCPPAQRCRAVLRPLRAPPVCA